MKRGFLVGALAAGLLMANFATAQTLQRQIDRPSITVVGIGEVEAKPDLAQVSVGVTTQAETASEALKANNRAMEQLLAALKQQGIAKTDIQTTQFNVSPQYQHEPARRKRPEIVGYQVTNQVQVKVRDLSKLGDILDAVVQEGANRIQGIQFSVADPAQPTDDARRKALADARRKAELYAREAGAALGPPLAIQEQTTGGPRPVFGRQAEVAAARAVPVEPGQQTLRVQVIVVYSLRTGQE